MSEMPERLEYRSAVPAQRRRSPAAQWIGCGVAWGFFTVVLMVLALGVTPRFERVFQSFAVQLPSASQAWLQFCHALAGWLGWVILPSIAATMLVLTWVVADVGGRPRAFAWSRRLAYLFLLGLVAIAIVCLGLPLVALVDSASGSGG